MSHFWQRHRYGESLIVGDYPALRRPVDEHPVMHNSKSAAHSLSSTWPLVYKDRTPILPKRDITRDSFYEKERQPNRWYSHQRNDYTQYALNKKGPGNQRYLLIHVLVCFLLFMNQEMDHHQSWLILTDHVGQSHFPSETVPKGGWSRAGTQTPLFYFPFPRLLP